MRNEVLERDPDYVAIWANQRAAFSRILTDDPPRVGVFCLSEKDDDLSQWRAYAPNGGVAIAFSRAGLKTLFIGHGDEARPQEPTLGRLVKCSYNKKAQIRKLAEMMAATFEKAKLGAHDPHNPHRDGMLHERAAKWFFPKVLKIAPTFKDHAFKAEVESRIVVQGSLEQLDFRPGVNLLIPYFPLFLDVSCIKRIRIGPTPEPELAESSVTRFAKRHNIAADILPMTTPARSSKL